MVSRKERTAAEVRAWLTEREAGQDETEEIISRLEEALVIDDHRFALGFASDKRQIAGWGRVRIASALAERGVSRDLIELALEDGDADDVERACHQLEVRGFRLGEPADRKRALAYLGRKGFAAEDSYEALRRVARNEGVELPD